MARFPQATIALLFLWASAARALFFYIEGTESKCFFEELPKDTLVVGMKPWVPKSSMSKTDQASLIIGTYKAEAYNQHTQQFHVTSDLSILMSVDELMHAGHRVVSQTTTSSDTFTKFTFTASESGQHRICFTPQGPAAISVGGWFNHAGSIIGGTKLHVELLIGESSKIESDDKDKIDNLSTRVQELNSRLRDIRKEQIYQREREAEFRDQSEATNAKIVRWTIIQLLVLGGTCAWQLSHLRSFFIKQKLT